MRTRTAFTLIEILIVVVILGILSAIVVPQFTSATNDAASAATRDQLVKVREALGVYYVRNNSTFPSVIPGNGTWGEMINAGGDYLKYPPKNKWVGGAAETIIVYGTGPDSAYQSAYGWIFDPATGDLWAGSFDPNDHPIPRP